MIIKFITDGWIWVVLCGVFAVLDNQHGNTTGCIIWAGCSLSASIIIVLFIVLDEVKALRKDIAKLK